MNNIVSVSLLRTSWNSSSEELGPSTDDGTAVPLTLPGAPTWGNKFPVARAPALFLLLPPKPKGPALKKCRGLGTLNSLTIGSGKGGKTKFLNFLFQVLSFCKVWVLLVLVLFSKGNEMGSEGNVSLTPLLHVLHGACPRAPANPSINSHKGPGAVPGLCWPHKAAAERASGAARTGTAWWPFPGLGQPCPKNTAHQLLTHTPRLCLLAFSGTIGHSGVSSPRLIRQYPR